MSTTSQECDKLCLKAFGKILSPPSGPAREADKNFIHRLISLTLKSEALRYPPDAAACGAAPALKKKTTWESVQRSAQVFDFQAGMNRIPRIFISSAYSSRLEVEDLESNSLQNLF